MKLGAGIRAIAVNGLGATGMTLAETLVRALYFVAITRLVGPEGYGIYSWAIALYGVVLGGASLGFETLVPYVYGKGQAEGDREAGLTLSLRLGLAMLATVGLVAYAQAVEWGEPEMYALLAVAPALLFRGTALLERSIYTGRMEVPRNVPNVLAARLAELALGLGLIVWGAGIAALLLLHWACWALEALLAWRGLHRRGLRLGLPRRDESLAMLRKGAPIGAMDLANGFLTAAPLVLYEPLARDTAELGQMGVAVQLAGFLLAAGFAFLGSAAPVLARTREVRDARMGHYGWLVALIAVLVCGGLALAWQVVSVPLIQLVFGHQYDLASELTTWTILVAGAVLLPHGFQQVLIMERRYWLALLANGAACALAIAGFARMSADSGPVAALQVVLAAWGLRAAIVIAAGWRETHRLLASFRTG
ncbi:MAG: oligosaccharide flippase family protein [Erythrobacter sp.]|nr:oligosaccharide flippase family protein [Erythrobacter sp.]